MAIKGIMFDLWDTLIYDDVKKEDDCFSAFARTVGYDMCDHNYLKVVEKHLMTRSYNDLRVPVRMVLDELDVEASEEVVEGLAELLYNKIDKEDTAKPYPEAFGVLKRLRARGFKLGLITNTYYQSMAAIEKKYSIERRFDASVKSYEIGLIKPDPRIFYLMLQRLGLGSNEAVMVGNSLKSDVQGAEKVGIMGVLVDRKNAHPNYARRVASLDTLQNFLH
jgi:2-haloalkanoic acid dehalogenase type II